MNKIRAFQYVWETRYSEGGESKKVLVLKMRIPDGLLLSVVFLFRNEEDARRVKKRGGSGFIASVPSTLGRLTHRYIITNKHVVDECDGNPTVLFNPFRRESHPLVTDPNKWHFHKNREGDDIAAYHHEFSSAGFGNYYTTVDSSRFVTESIIEDHDIGVGDQAFMLGRYVEVPQATLPSARFGNVSMMPAQPISSKKTKRIQESYLVEMYSVGGFSGAPVFVRKLPWSPGENFWSPGNVRRDLRWLPDYADDEGEILDSVLDNIEVVIEQMMQTVIQKAQDRFWLLGVNWGHLPYKDKQTVEGRDLHITLNRNVACVVPAEKILELLDEPKPVKEREKMEQQWLEEHEKDDEPEGAVEDMYPDSDMPSILRRTIQDKIDAGDEGVDEDVFRRAMDRAIFPDKPDQES